MTYINPLASALSHSLTAHHELSSDKTRQLRGRPVAPRGSLAQADQFEHQVESPEEAAAIHEEARKKRQPRGHRQQHLEDEPAEEDQKPEHIDLKA